MSYIQDDRITERLHFRYAPVVDDQVLITESRSTFSQHNVLVAGLYHLVCCKLHGKRREELSFFDINRFSGLSSSDQ